MRTQTLADPYDLLVRGLRAAFGGYGGGLEANFGDFAQEALIKITDNLAARTSSKGLDRANRTNRRSPRSQEPAAESEAERTGSGS